MKRAQETTIGVLRETKEHERRVAMTPDGARDLVRRGHKVVLEARAGDGAGFADDEYRAAGAVIAADAASIMDRARLLVKVKEPTEAEIALLREDHTLFAYLHLAAQPEMARGLAQTGATCIAYETVQSTGGALPLLAPMSEIAGRLAAHLGLHYLLAPEGGTGTLFGGVPGAPPARVAVVGGGVVGRHAAAVAVALGACVAVLDRSLERLRYLDELFGGAVTTLYSTEAALEQALWRADLVIGAVLVPGARAPRVLRRDHLSQLASGSVLIDVSIDQGGCAETSRPTTYAAPTYVVDDVRHAAVTNLPAAAARTATQALTNATLPYIQCLADLGTASALVERQDLEAGLNVAHGEVVHTAAAEAVSSAMATAAPR